MACLIITFGTDIKLMKKIFKQRKETSGKVLTKKEKTVAK